MAVTQFFVPVNLKSISQIKSSVPFMSVRITSCVSSDIIPIAIPLTGAFIGTHPERRASVDPQTLAIDVEPHDPSTSETSLMVYGNSSFCGIIGSSAFSASLP